MGRTIEALGIHQGHHFPLIIDLHNSEELRPEKLKEADVAIEFTTPDSAPENIMACLGAGIPIVSGTTGWNHRYREMADLCSVSGGTLFTASNFSIGVNILFTLNRSLAGIMNRFPGYGVSIREVHHTQKLDAPSGTAISLAEQIIDEHSRILDWKLKDRREKQDQEDNDEAGTSTEPGTTLYIEAIRQGEVKGEHSIRYESELDAITMEHTARSRDAFASGALMAAEFICGKTGIFGMEDLLKL